MVNKQSFTIYTVWLKQHFEFGSTKAAQQNNWNIYRNLQNKNENHSELQYYIYI